MAGTAYQTQVSTRKSSKLGLKSVFEAATPLAAGKDHSRKSSAVTGTVSKLGNRGKQSLHVYSAVYRAMLIWSQVPIRSHARGATRGYYDGESGYR